MPTENPAPAFRSGFCAIIGRPNVGKSTLINYLIGQKVAIISDKPQTTRRRIIGVRTTAESQIVFVDTPGYHKPKTHLGDYMVKVVKDESKEADVILFVVDATTPPRVHDRATGEYVFGPEAFGRPVFLVLNKSDLMETESPYAEGYKALGPFAAVYSTSAVTGRGLSFLMEAVEARLPEGPHYYPPEQKAEADDREWVRELIREKALELTRQEIPHSIAVEIEDFKEGKRAGTLYIRATLYVEKDSQKPILLGAGGKLMKEIGSRARAEVQHRLGKPVYLDLWVKVKPGWRDRNDFLKSIGYW